MQKPTSFALFLGEMPKDILDRSSNIEVLHFIDTEYASMINNPHWHHYYEIMLIMKGHVSVAANGVIRQIPEGSLAVIPPGIIHCTVIQDEFPVYERMMLHWNSEFSELFKTITGLDITETFHDISVLNCDVTDTGNFRIMMDKIKNEQARRRPYMEMICNSIALEFIMYCFRIYHSEKGKNTVEETSSLVSAVTHHIAENYTESTLSLEDIAGRFYVSEGYLSKIFREYTGTTVYQYIIQHRLLHACDLLIAGTSVTDACMESGFTDYTSFLKVFKKKYNITPREYVRQNRANHSRFVFGRDLDHY